MAVTRRGDRLTVDADSAVRVRLDQWLWAARFFKTRVLAVEAVAGGKVHVGGQRSKPSHAIRLGERLQIQRGSEEYVIIIKGLSSRRGPAKEAVLLYEETVESRQRREETNEQRRLQPPVSSSTAGRPTKQDRRRIVRFTHGDD